jgi:hypothetical protein
MKKEFPSKKDIETYNKVAAFINEQNETQASTQGDAGFEDDELTNRIPCLVIIAGVVTKVNCKTGEVIP